VTTRNSEIARYGLYGEDVLTRAVGFLHIEDIASRSRLYDWRIEPHSHPGMLQVVLVKEGEATFTTDKVTRPLDGPSIAFVPEGSVHAFSFSPDTLGWVLTLSEGILSDDRLSKSSIETIRKFGRSSAVSLATNERSLRRLCWLMTEITEQSNLERVDQEATLIWLVGLLLVELVDISSDIRTSSSRPGDAQLLARFRELIEAHYRDRWHVDDYARALAIGKGKLSRICRLAYGEGPGEIVLDRVLLEATRYLTYTSASAAQIGYQLGFSDAAYFSRFFKARTGMTPLNFRRSKTERSQPA
jgi:AraC family transcriptional regulator, transcriptional activator of pobA